jgi:CBS domain-containing protein
MRVRDVLTEAVITCRLETNLAAAIALLWENDCGTLPVLDHSGKLAGFLTDRHICIALGTRNARPSDLTASDVMESVVVTCKSSDHIRAALQIMGQAKVRRLPVVNENDAIEGVVSINDIVQNIRRDHGNADAISYGEMMTALQTIFARSDRLSCQAAAA